MHRYELTDEQWEAIAHLFPSPATTGRPAKPTRAVLNAIFWVLRSGAPWRDLPERYGPWQTIYHRFNAWCKDGTIDKLLETLQVRLDKDGYIDWDLWCIDGSSVRASRAAAGAGKRGAPQNPETTHWVARAADSAANSTWSLTVKACPSRHTSRPGKSTNRRSSKR
jgi:transposase